MLTSSSWVQACWPQGLLGHSARVASVPRQRTPSSQMGPNLDPKRDEARARMGVPQPSCRHTTAASFESQPSSQTVPHCWLWSTSNLPTQRFGPLTSRSVSEPPRSGSNKKQNHGTMNPGWKRWRGSVVDLPVQGALQGLH